MPRRLHFRWRKVGVAETLDQWHGPGYRYVKVRGDDGCLYILRHDALGLVWHLTLYATARGQSLWTTSGKWPSRGH